MSFRIGATVLIDSNCSAIQSYGFKTKRFLGDLEKVLKFLDAYKVDEIHAIVPYKGRNNSDLSEKIFSHLSRISISTPLGIGGGITEKNIKKIVQNPFFERCFFNSAIFNDIDILKKTTSIMGHQSMVASLPFSMEGGALKIYNSTKGSWIKIDPYGEFWKKVNRNFNEVLLLDSNAEGWGTGFNFEILEYIDFPMSRILISGGLTKNDISKARHMGLAGVSVDNFILHSEYSARGLR